MPIQLKPRALRTFQSRLLAWFRTHRRELPWRASRDPYRIWVAEIMLQQTRVAAVIPYYDRFLRRFPDVRTLARARQPEVLKFWSGLGYYSRARNLHSAAKTIMSKHNGEFPRDVNAALGLPGIGHYTAAAVLSIAYDEPLAVLDGNVARVLARLGACPRRFAHPAYMGKSLKNSGSITRARRRERLESSPHGTGRDNLHPAIAALPGLPHQPLVRSTRARPRQ